MRRWRHGKAHVCIFALSALATIAAPFLLAHAMRRRAAWVDFAGPTKQFGFVTAALLVVTGTTSGTEVGGLTQRIAATVVTGGVAILAWRVARLEAQPRTGVTLMAGR